MHASRSSLARAAATALALALLSVTPYQRASAAPSPLPIVTQPASTSVADRGAMLRTMRARFAKPVSQSFAILSGSLPVAEWKMVHSAAEVSAVKAGLDYQRRCEAGDASTPARVDSVRVPVAPGAVVQIAGDCFGKTPGSVTLSGLGPSPYRLAVQSWSSTAIAATVPGIPNAHHQTAVLAVLRAPGAAAYASEKVSAVAGSSLAAAGSRIATVGTAAQTASAGAATPVLGKPVSPAQGTTVYTTGSGAAAALSTPANEATVEFWPELERHTLAPEAIAKRTCAYPQCINAGEDQGAWRACLPPCADHEDESRTPAGTRPDTYHWLHAGDDTWVLSHPPNWRVERVDFPSPIGTVSAATPQLLNAQRTLLTVHWQDIHNVDASGDERGLWFFAGYTISVTMIGPKGTWP